jgi:hypothetical protein
LQGEILAVKSPERAMQCLQRAIDLHASMEATWEYGKARHLLDTLQHA